MAGAKRHHYVPRTYLRAFTLNPSEENSQIYYFDKVKSKSGLAGIQDIALERDFYTIKGKEDPLQWERFFCDTVEGPLAHALRQLNTNITLMQIGFRVITDDLKKTFADMMIYQMFRTKDARQFSYEKAQSAAADVLNPIIAFAEERGNDRAQKLVLNYKDAIATDENFFKEITLPVLFDEKRIARFSSFLQQMLWTVYYNQSEVAFATSDNPVTIHDFIDRRNGLGIVGLAQPFALLTYPISPRAALVLRHKTEYLDDAFFAFENKVTLTPESRIAQYLNRLQLENCTRFVYSGQPIGLTDLQ